MNNGVEIDNFDPDITNYTITIQEYEFPFIFATPAEYASYIYKYDYAALDTFPHTDSIIVTAEDGVTVNNYILHLVPPG